MTRDNPNDLLFVEDLAPWNANPNPVWLASTLLLHRNIEKYNFPSKLSLDRRKQIVALVGKEIEKVKSLKHPKILKSEEATPLEKEFLVEHFLTNENYQQAVSGEAFILDKTGTCALSVNVEDHLHFHYIDIEGNLEKGLNLVSSIENQIGKTLSYSYSSKFGFMTANPFTCGTGLVVSIFLQLSGLIQTGELQSRLKLLNEDDAVAVTSLLGTPHDYVGDLVVLQNQYVLGVNEESIISTMRNFTTKLLVEEQSMRRQIQGKDSAEIKDKVSRAYGLLIHSYQTETIEALNEIALLKFGLEMGWIKGITITELNQLFFSCRRAHLLKRHGEKVNLDEVTHHRASFIHQALKNVELTI